MKIISLDPGGCTGCAVGVLKKKDAILEVEANQRKFSHSELYSELMTSHPDIIVCESFEYRNNARAGLELISAELIGVVHCYQQQEVRLRDCRLYMQTASQGKGHFSDAKIKEAKLWLPGKPHAMDSLRHLLHWYTFGAGYQYNKQGFELASNS